VEAFRAVKVPGRALSMDTMRLVFPEPFPGAATERIRGKG
jgi:hypothetical protein